MEGVSEPPKRFCRALRSSEFPFSEANVALEIFILKSQGPADAHEAWYNQPCDLDPDLTQAV